MRRAFFLFLPFRINRIDTLFFVISSIKRKNKIRKTRLSRCGLRLNFCGFFKQNILSPYRIPGFFLQTYPRQGTIHSNEPLCKHLDSICILFFIILGFIYIKLHKINLIFWTYIDTCIKYILL